MGKAKPNLRLGLSLSGIPISDFITEYKEKIYTSIYLLIKDKSLAEDIFQEVFIKVINKLNEGKYTDKGRAIGWVMQIARNLCMDHFRKVKRSPRFKTSEDRDVFETLKLDQPGVDSTIMKSQGYEKIRKMVDLLPDDQREVIILRHYADLSFKEIAHLTQCSINTALGRMRYALINLRKMVQEKNIAL